MALPLFNRASRAPRPAGPARAMRATARGPLLRLVPAMLAVVIATTLPANTSAQQADMQIVQGERGNELHGVFLKDFEPSRW